MKGAVVMNDAGKAYLCLGFRTWGAIGVNLQQFNVGGKACFPVFMFAAAHYPFLNCATLLSHGVPLSAPQVMFAVDKANKEGVVWPHWLLNINPVNGPCGWRMCKVRPVLPTLVPAQLRTLHSVLQVTDGPYSMPAAAVKFGCYMQKPALRKLALANGILVPEGTGAMNKKTKQRSVLKPDWAWALAHKFWSAATQEEQQAMVDGMCRGFQPKLRAPMEVLKSVQMLDHDNAETFRDLQAFAERAQEEAEKAQGRGRLDELGTVLVEVFEWFAPYPFPFHSTRPVAEVKTCKQRRKGSTSLRRNCALAIWQCGLFLLLCFMLLPADAAQTNFCRRAS